MLAKDRVFAIRAGTYTSSDIKEASFNYGYISGDTFKPGGTVAGSAKLTFTSIITTFNKLDKIYPEIGLLVGDSYEWVAMGEYFVNDISIDRNRNTTELDLMDGMFKLNQPYISDLTYPAQIRDVIREICVKTGVELETDNLGLRAIQRHIEAKADKKDITFREVLSQAIQLLGFSAFFNRRGKLEIRGLTDSRITVTADNYFLHGLTKSEIQYQIAGITCKKDKETLTVGLRTGRSLELENSFMNQNLLDDLYYDLKEIKYYPFSLDWQGHLKLDVGQWVTLKTNKNETYKVPVLSQSFNFKGGLKSKISADSKAGNDTQYSYKGFLTKQIEQMSTQIDAEIQQQLEYANAEFDRKAEEYKKELDDDLEKSKAAAELYADNIKQEIAGRVEELDRQFQTNQQEQDRQIEESLRRAGASTDLANAAKTIAESTQANVEQTRSTLTNLVNQSTAKVNQMEQSVGTIRTDVASQARTLLAQAQAQTDLTNRVTTVENLADGTRSTVSELSRTMNEATQNIASVTNRTRTVEDSLSQTRTQYEALSQTVNSQTGQIDSINRKTADLQSGIDGVRERFESIQIGGTNLLSLSKAVKGFYKSKKGENIPSAPYAYGVPIAVDDKARYVLQAWSKSINNFSWIGAIQLNNEGQTIDNSYLSIYPNKTSLYFKRDISILPNAKYIQFSFSNDVFGDDPNLKIQFEKGSLPTDYKTAEEDQQSYADTKIAEYRNTVDGQFVNLQTQVNGKADQTDFQRVQTTSQLYERIIGSTEDAVREKVARMVMADSLFQTEVKDTIRGTATQVSQLAGSWAVQNLTSAGTVLNQLNLNKDGSVKIDGKLVHITGQTVIDDAAIASAKIASLDAGKITSGYISGERFRANSITAEKLKVDKALFDKLAADVANVKNFFANSVVATSLQTVTLSATQIQSGVLKSLNERTTFDLLTGKLTFKNGSPSIEFNSDKSAIRRVTDGQSQFIKFASKDGGTYTTIGASRVALDEFIGTATFTGIQIQSRSDDRGGLIDKIYAYADEFVVDGGGGQPDGFVFKNRMAFYPQSSGMLNLGRLSNRWNNVYAFDYYVGQNAVSLRTFLDAVRACFQQIGHGGMTPDTYKLIKDNLTNVFNRIQ
ncbi:gp58-like family protein [Streptococcus suis]|uniref:gp58-like family protein n=1 Tax=Streptococcus suis TaxID=1307 RepID=UPI003AF452CD